MSTDYLLFFDEPTRFHGVSAWSWTDRWCSMFGLLPVVITERMEPNSEGLPKVYATIEEAMACPTLQGLTWVWFDHRAEQTTDDFVWPTGGAVYCVGSDTDGFGFGDELPEGSLVKLPLDIADDAIFWSFLVPMICLMRRGV